jgi:hypothetical protein
MYRSIPAYRRSGYKRASKDPHVADPQARLRPSRYELLGRDDVWAEFERRGATIACVGVESAATGLGETAITAMETLEREMAVIAISDGEVYVELRTLGAIMRDSLWSTWQSHISSAMIDLG